MRRIEREYAKVVELLEGGSVFIGELKSTGYRWMNSNITRHFENFYEKVTNC